METYLYFKSDPVQFNPDNERDDYEIDQVTLLKRVKFLLNTLDEKGDISKASEQVYSIK